MQKKLLFAFGPLIYITFLCWLSYQQLSVPEPALPGKNLNSFSAYRAIDHIAQLAKVPHAGGTSGHKQVRNYIYDFCKENDLETKVFEQTGIYDKSSYLRAGRAYNILGKLKGTDNSKAVLFMAHYDSQPNTQGASDNAAGVGALLETIELLSKGDELKNDVYFLFTDLEEYGLLGAEAFVSSFPELNNIGLVLNFDVRGNAGANLTFETSSENGWVVKEYSNAVKNPIINSLAYEVYKLLPNDTDYTPFRKAGITGLNTGFVDGFAYYHGPADKAQYLSLGSLQQMGDLIWQSVNYFGNIDLTETKSEDVIFFSVFGVVFVYSKMLDLILIIVTGLLFIIVGFKLFKNKEISIKSFFAGFGIYTGSLVLGLVFSVLVELLILLLNPHFKNFYGYGFYNVNTYLITFIGTATLAYFTFNSIWRKVSSTNHLFGGLFLQLIFLILLKIYVPSGSYIIYIPMIIGLIFALFKTIVTEDKRVWFDRLILIVPIIVWVPMIIILYTIFSLQMPLGAVVFIILTLPYISSLFTESRNLFRWTMPFISFGLIVLGIIIGQFTASPTTEKPQLTQLSYAWDVDENEALWLSSQNHLDDFVSAYIHNDERKRLVDYGVSSSKIYMTEESPVIDIPTARIDVVLDTLIEDYREVVLRIFPSYEVTHFNLELPDSTYISQVDDRLLENKHNRVQYSAPPKNGCLIKIKTYKKDSLDLNLIESKLGISRKLLVHPLPDNYAFGPGFTNNTMLLKKKIHL